MFLRLNEQEVIDCVCVEAANYFHVDPEDIDVTEIKAFDNGDIVAYAKVVGAHHNVRDEFDLNDIMSGIVTFLAEFHDFNPAEMVVRGVNYNRHEGFWAEVTVGER